MKRFLAEAFNYEAEMEVNHLTQEDIDNFREILLSCDEVPRSIPDHSILTMLIMRNKNQDESVRLARAYCLINREAPEFFGNRDVESKAIQACFENQFYLYLPPTPDNCNLVFFKLSNYDPKNYIFDDAEKTFLMSVGE